MNIKEKIVAEHSKFQTILIANYIGQDKKRFETLLKLFLGNDYIISQRAAWIVSHCAEKNPNLVKPYLGKLIRNLKRKDLHNAVKRNTIRLFQYTEIPRSLLGDLTNLCFSYLTNVKESIAVKAFSMTVLVNISRREPELKTEIKLVIQGMLPYGSAGIRARGKKVLKALEKL